MAYLMKAYQLAKELVDIPSVSGNEKLLGDFLERILREKFSIKKQQVDGRFNLLASLGRPRLILSTHMDTVPGLLKVRAQNGVLYGRGACDAKGIIAAMVCAALAAQRDSFTNFGLLFDVGEEGSFEGVKRAITFVKPEVMILGEPTDLRLVAAQKGLLGLKIICRGRATAGSTPENGESAIEKLIYALGRIKSIRFPSSKYLGRTTVNVGKISGGSAPNVVADYAEADVEIRTVASNRLTLRLLKRAIGTRDVKVNYSFEPVRVRDKAFLGSFGLKSISVPYFTEMYFWAKMCKTAVFGPGRYELAHTNMESVKEADLEIGMSAYLSIIKRFSDRV